MQKLYPDRILKKLANLQFAIILLFLICLIVALGTFIEQDQTINFYKLNYPTVNPILKFIDWRIILFLHLDRVYSSWWFFLIIFIFSLSLLSCTLTVQFPSLRRFKRWKFYNNFENLDGIKSILPANASNNFAYQLHLSKYHIFRQGKTSYAYSGLLGRVGPIVVHASLILLLFGTTISSLQGFVAQEIVPRGEIFHIQNLVKVGSFSNISQNLSWRVNDFWITYTDTLKTNQFYSDLSILDNLGNELKRKTIFVNEPFIYKEFTLYQTDWDIVGLKVQQTNGSLVQLPLKKVLKNNKKFWFSTLNLDSNVTLSVLINDLEGTMFLYDQNGTFLQRAHIGEKINYQKFDLLFLDYLTSTGLQIKSDQGLIMVYLSFFFLIISVYVSFISYSQIWILQDIDNLSLQGNSNRAVLLFQTEFRKLIRQTSK